jgi:anti-anti-sigma regulatory factor
MPTTLNCLTTHGHPYAVARIVGVLDLPGAVAVRAALLKCLAEQPDAIVVDLSRMRLGDPSALNVFLALARRAAIWPAVPLVLCGARPDTAELLRLRAVDRRLPLMQSVSVALRWLRRGGAVPFVTEELLPVMGAGRRARELVTEACLRWQVPGLVGPACTVVTELVNNVVAHAHTMMTLRLSRRGRYLHVAVRDGSTQPPILRRGQLATASSGRGMALVESVSRRWGTVPADGGKVVWAALDLGLARTQGAASGPEVT